MSEPRIVTPQEAQEALGAWGDEGTDESLALRDLAHTVATEPDRIRAAVVEGIVRATALPEVVKASDAQIALLFFAQALENGAPL